MTAEPGAIDHDWLFAQVKEFERRRNGYRIMAETLQRVLSAAAGSLSPYAIVQARAKAVPSFAEKIQRKLSELPDPVSDMTDLCGGRVITLTQGEVHAMCAFIEQNFIVDWENSVDVTQRQKVTEFGYRSVHYIVSFKPGVFPTRAIPIEIPDTLYPDASDPKHPSDATKLPNPRCEIQVRTLLEHAWAAVGHDRMYKAGFKVPASITREFAGVAAMLENADSEFTRVLDSLDTYRSTYGAYMDEAKIRAEIDLQRFVLEQDPDNAEIASRMAAMAMAAADWDLATEVLEPFAAKENPQSFVLRDLGVALCEVAERDQDSQRYARGRASIERAIELDPSDAQAVAALARTWVGAEDERARELFLRAYSADPSDPYSLAGYLEAHLALGHDASVLGIMTPSMTAAVSRCRAHIDAAVNSVDAHLTSGILQLLMGDSNGAIRSYASGVAMAPSGHPLDSALESLARMERLAPQPLGLEAAQRLLRLALSVRFPGSQRTASPTERLGAERFSEPVLVLVGALGAPDPVSERFRSELLRSLQGFSGTVVGLGNADDPTSLLDAAAGVIGDSGRVVGYSGDSLAYWDDVVASVIDPASVCVLGCGGDALAAVEYRIALALGATVAVITSSGYEEAALTTDPDWAEVPNRPLSVPNDATTFAALLAVRPSVMDESLRERLARQTHGMYVAERAESLRAEDPALQPWETLLEGLKRSSYAQAEDIDRKVRLVGYEVVEVADAPATFEFEPSEIEILAEQEHGRWNAERLKSGWVLAKQRNVAELRSPYLVGWDELPEEVREWDRDAVRSIPALLASAGLGLKRT